MEKPIFILSALVIFVTFCESRQADNLFLRPRCVSRCISEEEQSRVVGNTTGKSRACSSTSRNPNCNLCTLPCERPRLNLSACLETCGGNIECTHSCAFLSDIRHHKPGLCSAPSDFDRAKRKILWGNGTLVLEPPDWNATSCSAECESDFDCKKNEKCCTVDCAPVCRKYVTENAWLPRRPIAESVEVREKLAGNVSYAALSWRSKNKPWTIYVVQEKSAIFPETFAKTRWKTIHEVKSSGVSLHHLRRGWTYKFRVASVNQNGSRGFTRETRLFTLFGEPLPPPAPSSFQISLIRFKPRFRFNLLVVWKMEKNYFSDLPIEGFFLSRHNLSDSGVAEKEWRKCVPFSRSRPFDGDELWSSWVNDLEPYVTHRIYVTSFSVWNNSHHVSTSSANVTFVFPPPHPKERVTDLNAELPFLAINGSLSVKITWKFRFTEAPSNLVRFLVSVRFVSSVLEERSREFEMRAKQKNRYRVIDGLEFASEYEISVRALYGSFKRQMGEPQKLRLFTPPAGWNQKKFVERRESGQTCREVSRPTSDIYWSKYAGFSLQLYPEMGGTFTAKIHRNLRSVAYDAVFVYVAFSDLTPLKWEYLTTKDQSCEIKSLPALQSYAVYFVTVRSNRAIQEFKYIFRTGPATENNFKSVNS